MKICCISIHVNCVKGILNRLIYDVLQITVSPHYLELLVTLEEFLENEMDAGLAAGGYRWSF